MTLFGFCCNSIAPDDPLIWVRAVHYAATMSVGGAIFFQAFIAEPAFRKAVGNGPIAEIVRRRLEWLTWSGLVITVASGAAWFLRVAANMLDLPVTDILAGETMRTVAADTDFGRDWVIRLLLVGVLTGSVFPFGNEKLIGSAFRRLIAVGSAAALVATLAWAGRGAAGSGFSVAIHLISDLLHLIAAAAWIGALLPLALLIGAAGRADGEQSVATAREAVLRFSTFGILSVGTLLVTGIVNSWMLVGSLLWSRLITVVCSQ